MAGHAVRLAADEVRKSVTKGAASLLEAAEEDIRVGGGEAWVASAPERRVGIGARRREKPRKRENRYTARTVTTCQGMNTKTRSDT